MNKISKALIAALVFGGSVSTATAAGVITKIEATDTAGGSLDVSSINTDRTIDLTKTFTSINPITLTFTVDHQDGGRFSILRTGERCEQYRTGLGRLSLQYYGA